MTPDADPPVSTTKIAACTINGIQIESLMDVADREAAALGLSREEYLVKMGWRRVGGLWLAKKKAKYFLTPEEFERLRAELPEHLGLAAEFAVETGLRMRSLLGLTWDRVNLKTARAWVPSDADEGDGGQKSGNNFGFDLSPARSTS